MNLLEQLDFYAQNHGQDIAVRSGDSFFTYEQLDHYSGRLANAIPVSYTHLDVYKRQGAF